MRPDDFDFLLKITSVPFHAPFITLDLLDTAAERPLLDYISQVCTPESLAFEF